MDPVTLTAVLTAVAGGSSIIANLVATLRKQRLPRVLRFAFGILLPVLVMLVATVSAILVGVVRSSDTGQAASVDLAHARGAKSGTATFLIGRATERATYSTAQATQGLVLVTVGVVAATVLAAIGFGAERVAERSEDRSMRQSTVINAEKVYLRGEHIEGPEESANDAWP